MIKVNNKDTRTTPLASLSHRGVFSETFRKFSEQLLETSGNQYLRANFVKKLNTLFVFPGFQELHFPGVMIGTHINEWNLDAEELQPIFKVKYTRTPWTQDAIECLLLREKCPNTEFFLVRIFLYSVRIHFFGHFSSSVLNVF